MTDDRLACTLTAAVAGRDLHLRDRAGFIAAVFRYCPWSCGNQHTVSDTFRYLGSKWPLLPGLISFAFGVVIGHIFLSGPVPDGPDMKTKSKGG